MLQKNRQSNILGILDTVGEKEPSYNRALNPSKILKVLDMFKTFGRVQQTILCGFLIADNVGDK